MRSDIFGNMKNPQNMASVHISTLSNNLSHYWIHSIHDQCLGEGGVIAGKGAPANLHLAWRSLRVFIFIWGHLGRAKETHRQLTYNLSVKLGCFLEELRFYLSSSCLSPSGAQPDQIRPKWRVQALLQPQQSTEAAHALKSSSSAATSSILGRPPNLQRHTWPLPPPFIFCKYEARGHGVTIMVVDRRRLETVGGTSPCPSGLLSPLSHSAPPDTRGREPVGASWMQTCPHHPGVLSPDRPSPRWVTCLLSPLSWRRTQPCSSS